VNFVAAATHWIHFNDIIDIALDL